MLSVTSPHRPPATESLAAVFHGDQGSVVLSHIPTPKPRGREVLVRVEACTLCGSDLHSFKGTRKVAVPTILGHEIVGRIEAFGPDAPRTDASGLPLAIGTRIVWGIVASCGECFCCQRGLTQKCLRAFKYGHQPFTEGYELLGGLAEHCLLVPGTTILQVPESLCLEAVAPCGCATATIAAAMESVDTLEGRTVLITGAGLLGLTAAAMARSLGAAEVIISDINSARLMLVAKYGATRCVLPADIGLVVGDATNGYGVDLALEVSGATQAFESLWPHVRLGGTIALVGAVFPNDAISLSMEHIVRRNLTIRGIHNYGTPHLIKAIKFLTEHASTYHLDSVVARWFPLSEIREAFKAGLEPDYIRIGVRP
jgi:putative phosphonate catabolism associated alcohol dehydrogenase